MYSDKKTAMNAVRSMSYARLSRIPGPGSSPLTLLAAEPAFSQAFGFVISSAVFGNLIERLASIAEAEFNFHLLAVAPHPDAHQIARLLFAQPALHPSRWILLVQQSDYITRVHASCCGIRLRFNAAHDKCTVRTALQRKSQR